MGLYTKSAQNKLSKKDGVIICVMRRPNKGIKFDLWFPVLSPPSKLLNQYIKENLDWEKFKNRFKNNVISKYREHFKILVEISKKRKVTIVCWEKSPEKCHRRLIAEECKRIDPSLKVVLK